MTPEQRRALAVQAAATLLAPGGEASALLRLSKTIDLYIMDGRSEDPKVCTCHAYKKRERQLMQSRGHDISQIYTPECPKHDPFLNGEIP